MSVKNCCHIQYFKKKPSQLETLKWIHAVFVISDTSTTRKAKIGNTYCRTCWRRGPILHACLECVYFGCHKHIREHAKHQKHTFSMELYYGQIHCVSCNDYIYDAEIDDLTMDNKMKSAVFKKRLFESSSWNASEEEKELLKCKTKKICITPDSPIGLRGLTNLGLTCYMNSVIQALIHTPFLRDYFLTERHSCKSTVGACLVCEMTKIFQEFYKGSRLPLALNELLHFTWINASHLAGYAQQDAHEFFISTLNLLHKHCVDTTPKGNDVTPRGNEKCPCIIDQIFSGDLQSDLVCKKCNGVSTKIDPIWDFSLDLGPVTLGGRQQSSLDKCLERFTEPESLGEIFCSKCQSYEESTKQFTMRTLPNVVSIHLKRFEHTTVQKKVPAVISFPEMLDMTPFMSRNEEQTPFPIDNRYTLFAVIIHIGERMDMGHYVTYVRQQHNYWYKCNDEDITRVKLEDVLASEGYLLFYHKHVLEYE
ncbi:unnamed protein product [Phyllotreta striolata]|uniref:ubiquitinyl hydrolase 1 n=1 Tax=Phyllotreta striolata TaxID=444603 RepID=A0A9N9XQV7_PHYSR|nr:unnamed protein product [Phyllotreta striolata]